MMTTVAVAAVAAVVASLLTLRVSGRRRRRHDAGYVWRHYRMARGLWGLGVQRAATKCWFYTLGPWVWTNEPNGHTWAEEEELYVEPHHRPTGDLLLDHSYDEPPPMDTTPPPELAKLDEDRD